MKSGERRDDDRDAVALLSSAVVDGCAGEMTIVVRWAVKADAPERRTAAAATLVMAHFMVGVVGFVVVVVVESLLWKKWTMIDARTIVASYVDSLDGGKEAIANRYSNYGIFLDPRQNREA